MGAEPIGPMPNFASKSAFWRELRLAVNAHLASEAAQGRPAVGDPRLQRKAALILGWFGLSYSGLLAAPSLPLVMLTTLSLAFAAAAIGFGVFHDANHRTLFRLPAGNLWAARLCSILLGPSRHLWVHKHQTLHHRQPNVAGWDDDLETRGFLRLSPASPWEPRHQRQEFKAFLYYGLNSLEWVFWKDFLCMARGRLNEWQALKLDTSARIELLVSKALYLALFVAPPFLLLPITWALIAFFAFHFVFSWTLAAVFQVAHLTSEMEFGGVRPGDDWAMHQVRTTADFATSSRLTTWYSGGLNHQIEHHLFPNVSHTHYAALRPLVRAAAERHGLHLHDLGSMNSAIRQHLALLKKLGRPELTCA
jgi:linoleoyl-CoA desaturase